MQTVKLTLELPYKQACEVLAFVNTLSGSISEPSEPELTTDDSFIQEQEELAQEAPKATVMPTAGKKTSMPSFGRSQAQVDIYANSETSRIDEADEEAELRARRKEKREAKKVVKNAVLLEKQEDKQRATDEVAAIKEAVVETTPTQTVKKPWEL